MRSFIALLKSVWRKVISFFRGIRSGAAGDEPPADFVDYYGCPNSDRAKKLQTGRRAYR